MKKMVGVVVVTHCHLAEELIAAAQLVVGEDLKQFQPVSIDPKVAVYVLQWDETKEFLKRVQEFIGFLLPLYTRERKTHLTIAVGCTGGRHRSIVIANRLAEMLRDELAPKGVFLSVRHRDAERG